MDNIREQLIASYKNNSFLETVGRLYRVSGEEREDLCRVIISLHNDNTIDFLTETCAKIDDESFAEHDFYLVKRIIEKVLPELNVATIQAMDCVRCMVAKSGADMMATVPYASFSEYCEKDEVRIKEALDLIAGDPDSWRDFIAPAIAAGSRNDVEKYADVAFGLSESPDVEVKRRAAFSLGRIEYAEKSGSIDKAINRLDALVSEDDDLLRANCIKSLWSICQKHQERCDDISSMIDRALVNNDDVSIHSASEIFAFDTKDVSDSLMAVIIPHLKHVNPKNNNTLSNIDYGLTHLLNNGKEEAVIDFLSSVLISHAGELSLRSFDSLVGEIYTNRRELLNKLVTKWFMSFNLYLCSAVRELVGVGFDRDVVLSVDTSEVECNDERLVFILRKVIGYLYTYPVSCVSFIVSALESGLLKDNTEYGALLFDPVLISYPRKAREYIESVMGSVKPETVIVLRSSLDKLDEYHDGLRSAENISELRPPQEYKEVYARHMSRLMSESFKEAQKDSILNLIASKSVLLYGRKSINYVRGHDGEFSRMETPLQSFGTSIDFPNLQNIDPHGLDYMLRVFRVEGCTK
jgi:hypothetical protein